MPTRASLADRRRSARRLVADGRGFAAGYGLPVTNNPASLFQLLCLAMFLARPGDPDRAVRTTRLLRERGLGTAKRLAALPPAELAALLRSCRWQRDPDRIAGATIRFADVVAQRYGGDLRRLRSAARRAPGRERALLTELPEVDARVVDLFLRETQAFWPEVAPVVDARALAAARRLGLARSAAELAEVAGTAEPERLSWLVGSLARIDLGQRR